MRTFLKQINNLVTAKKPKETEVDDIPTLHEGETDDDPVSFEYLKKEQRQKKEAKKKEAKKKEAKKKGLTEDKPKPVAKPEQPEGKSDWVFDKPVDKPAEDKQDKQAEDKQAEDKPTPQKKEGPVPFSNEELTTIDELEDPVAVLLLSVSPEASDEEKSGLWESLKDMDDVVPLYPRTDKADGVHAFLGSDAAIQDIKKKVESRNNSAQEEANKAKSQGKDTKFRPTLLDYTKLPAVHDLSKPKDKQTGIFENPKLLDAVKVKNIPEHGMAEGDIRSALTQQWQSACQTGLKVAKDNKAEPKPKARTDIDKKSLTQLFKRDPYVVIVSAKNDPGGWAAFAKEQQAFLSNPQLVFQLYPTGETGSGDLKDMYAFLVPKAEASKFEKVGLPVDMFTAAQPSHPDPFRNMEYTKLKENPETMRRVLTDRWKEIIEAFGGEKQSMVPAMQMQSDIPLNYLRFLGEAHRKYELYIGGRPAGSKGLVYVKASQEEFDDFQKFLNWFKPRAKFDHNLWMTTLDPEFLDYSPNEYTPQSALIIEAKAKFIPNDPKHLVEIPKTLRTDEEEKAYAAKPGDKKPEEKQEPGKDPGDQGDGLPRISQHELFIRIAQQLMHSLVRKPGRLINGLLVHGDLIVHYNADMTKAIIFGGRSKATVNAQELKKEMASFVKAVDTKYL